jgi:DNA-binding IclR family transcriptional regulator
VLNVLEAIARHQPIGIRALARLIDEDKSAVHRAVLTLADAGWVRANNQSPPGWEVTFHILALAHAAHGSNDLLARARPLLERLRDQSGETALLVVPDTEAYVIADVIESRQALRMVPHVGEPVEVHDTATARALLPFLTPEQRLRRLGARPDKRILDAMALTRKRGYAINDGEINPATTNIAAAIFEFDGSPVGAVVLIGPRERMPARLQDRLGKWVVQAARDLSRGSPTSPPASMPRAARKSVSSVAV